MKDKVLHSEINKAAEGLLLALRKYTDEPLYFSLTIFSKDNTVICEGDPDGVPDFFSVRLLNTDSMESIYNEASRVYYSEGEGEELIKKVIPFGGVSYDSQE